MEQLFVEQDLKIAIDGMGIAIYSEAAMKDIQVGYNFFDKEFRTPAQVAQHIKTGDITAFCTGSGGNFTLKIRNGYPSQEISNEYPVSIRLALDVMSDYVCFKDIFWLMDWSTECPEKQKIIMNPGKYKLTVLTQIPESGIWGDEQTIYIYFKAVVSIPELTWKGVPQLFVE